MTIRFPNLDLEWEFIPRAFYFLGFEFTFLGLLIAAGMLLGLFVIVMDAKRKKKNPNHYLGMTILVILGSLIGGRLLYAACNWEIYQDNLMDLFQLRNGGMSLFGAMAGGIVFGALYCLIARQPFWDMADTIALGALLVQTIGRWGDFFNRESFGEYVDYILSMQLPLASVRTGEVTELMRENIQELQGVSYIQVNPLFLYESVGCFLILVILLAMNRRKAYPGAIFMRYLCYYGALRCCIEWFRTDKMLLPGTELDLNLIIAAGMFVFFGLMARVRSVMTRKREDLRREQRERHYQQEEAAEAEMDAKDAIRERIGRERLEEANREVEKMAQSIKDEGIFPESEDAPQDAEISEQTEEADESRLPKGTDVPAEEKEPETSFPHVTDDLESSVEKEAGKDYESVDSAERGTAGEVMLSEHSGLESAEGFGSDTAVDEKTSQESE